MIRYKKMNESSPLEISRSQISGDEILRREQTDIPGLELLETQRIVDDTTCVLFFILDDKKSSQKPTVLWSSRFDLKDIENGKDQKIFDKIAEIVDNDLIKLGGISINDQLDRELRQYKRIR